MGNNSDEEELNKKMESMEMTWLKNIGGTQSAEIMI